MTVMILYMDFAKVNNDIDSTRNISEAGSPRVLYTTFLLGLLREFFGLVMSSDVPRSQIEDGFSCLIAFCPDKNVRTKIWKNYLERIENSDDKVRSAAIQSTGEMIDYLTSVLDLTSVSNGAYL